jgi:hypothetical protein
MLLIDRPFIAYYPELGVALGSPVRAIIVQLLWFHRDRATSETTMPMDEIAARTGFPKRTIEDHVKALRADGVLTSRRAARFDSTTVWTVHPEVIPDTTDSAESDTTDSADSGTTDSADSESTDSAESYLVEQEEVSSEVVSKSAPIGVPDLSGPPPPAWVQQIPWLDRAHWDMCADLARHVDPVASVGSYLAWCESHPDASESFAGFWKWLAKDEADAKNAHLAANTDAAFYDFIYHRQNHEDVDA